MPPDSPLPAALSIDGWRSLWRALGAAVADDALHAELLAVHGEPRRHYHSRQHLEECLRHLDEARALAAHPDEVALALWFHDAVYEPMRSDNEERSAHWAGRAARAAGVAEEAARRIEGLVLATRHRDDAPPTTDDEALIVDIDLAILGADVRRFDEYERQVRAEYSGVPGILFRRKRRAVLEGFVARASIFRTAPFRERYEAKARENLRRSIAKLKA